MSQLFRTPKSQKNLNRLVEKRIMENNDSTEAFDPEDVLTDSEFVDDVEHDAEDEDDDDYEQMPEGMMTLDGHLSELRRTFLHSLLVAFGFACVAFAWKEWVFRIVFAPSKSDFILYRWINSAVNALGLNSMHLDDFAVQMINTELSSQFMTHISVSFYFGLLAASPYIVYKLLCFVRPALYDNEKRYSTIIVLIIYILFAFGLLLNYFVIFPISFRFLGTYQVDTSVINTIALSSYISSFTLLSLMMGLVFEVPVLAFVLGKIGLITANMLANYRKIAFIGILVISAMITPPDVFSLLLMTVPLYGLYELSILVLKRIRR